jgi:hypothetical protein
MKLKDLKEVLNNLTEEQLEGNLIANGYGASGAINEIKPAETNIYLVYDDCMMDEKETAEAMQDEGWDKMPEPYIKKGEMLFNF